MLDSPEYDVALTFAGDQAHRATIPATGTQYKSEVRLPTENIQLSKRAFAEPATNTEMKTALILLSKNSPRC